MTRTFKLGASKPHEAPVHEGAQIFVDIGTLVRDYDGVKDERVDDGYAYKYSPLYLQ